MSFPTIWWKIWNFYHYSWPENIIKILLFKTLDLKKWLWRAKPAHKAPRENSWLNVTAKKRRNQWRSQPDNLVSLCKFWISIIIHFFRNWLFSQSTNSKYLHSGTKSSGWLRYWSKYFVLNVAIVSAHSNLVMKFWSIVSSTTWHRRFRCDMRLCMRGSGWQSRGVKILRKLHSKKICQAILEWTQ